MSFNTYEKLKLEEGKVNKSRMFQLIGANCVLWPAVFDYN